MSHSAQLIRSCRLERLRGGRLGVWRSFGFTLVELLIVVVLIGIVAAVAIPGLGDSSVSRLRGAAILMAGDIQYVQALAIQTSQVLYMEFPGGNRYVVVDPDGGAGGSRMVLRHPERDHPAHNGSYIVDFDDSGPLHGVAIQSASFDGASRVEFGKYGEPAASGEVVLRSGDYQLRITVAAITGRVTIGKPEPARLSSGTEATSTVVEDTTE